MVDWDFSKGNGQCYIGIMSDSDWPIDDSIEIRGAEFNTVYVIDSLRATDKHRTGEELYALVRQMAERGQWLSCAHMPCESREEFLSILVYIYEEVLNKGAKPIIHIEAHASRHVLQFTNGDTIDWRNFGLLLQGINRASKQNLVVVIAACEGAFLWSKALPYEHAPFWGVVAPAKKVYPDAIAEFRTFYTELHRTQDFIEAVKAMNQNIADPEEHFIYLNAELGFEMLFTRITHGFKGPDGVRMFADQIRAESDMFSDIPDGVLYQEVERFLKKDHSDLKRALKARFMGWDQ